jgi:hypothetical protein
MVNTKKKVPLGGTASQTVYCSVSCKVFLMFRWLTLRLEDRGGTFFRNVNKLGRQ